ncbi:MAG: putative addiction module component, family [candidate division NC10 bacterium]|nr:putative addiction module component, family [candidate division NC10 bacterium]
MSPQAREVLAQALKLSPLEKAELVERILDTFVLPDRKAIDERWAAEAEDRIDAYERGAVVVRSVTDVFARIERSDA